MPSIFDNINSETQRCIRNTN
uniref:Uncharacterized protein n=1 Tax=Arundo donax TaxID=35708 RepID=A0A0A8ZRC7_ARUDO